MKKTIILVFLTVIGTMIYSAPTYEYRRPLREGARGKWSNLRQHLNSGQRLEKELIKVDKQIDKKVNEIQEIEELLFRIEQYKAENNIR
jgi:peptidoglycan hydrolase CwlO-like protein